MREKRNTLRQRGSSLAEFIYTAPILLLLGLGSVQAGLIYHGKTTVNYAAFEAARHGAVNHAQISEIKSELAYRLAPIYGGDGTTAKAAQAIAHSKAASLLPARTNVRILNPTPEAFNDWGEMSLEDGVKAIPNSHLRNRNAERATVGSQSGVNLHDANLLKIKVTHGFEMKIPIVAAIIAKGMIVADPPNSHYYLQNQIPLTSVVTVRMQNEAWEQDWEAGVTPPGVTTEGTTTEGTTTEGATTQGTTTQGTTTQGSTTEGATTQGTTTQGTTTEGATTGGTDDIVCDTTWEDARYTANTDNRWWNPLDWTDDIKAAAAVVWDFLEGVLAGLGDQVKDLWNLLKDPSVMVDIAKAFISDPKGTITQLIEGVVQDAQKILKCGPKDVGRVIGQNINPVAAVKLLSKLGDISGNAKLARYADDMEQKVTCSSFPVGTSVWTPDGLTLIENVQNGTVVHARNEISLISKPQPVVALFSRTAPGFHLIETEFGDIRLTPEHPVWVQGRGWVDAKNIVTEDPIATMYGDVLAFSNTYVDQLTPVYNFTVANTHNYFVGEMGLWVHNAGNSSSIKCGLTAHVPEKIELSELGGMIGEGGVKKVYDWKDGLVVGVAKPGKNPQWVVNEYNALKTLGENGLPVVKVHGLTKVDGRQAIVMSKVDGFGSKDVVKNVNGKPTIVGASPDLNAKSIQDLKNIRNMLIEKKISVDDLQFIIGKDGSVKIADPAGIQLKPPSTTNKQTIDLLIQAAEKNL